MLYMSAFQDTVELKKDNKDTQDLYTVCKKSRRGDRGKGKDDEERWGLGGVSAQTLLPDRRVGTYHARPGLPPNT